MSRLGRARVGYDLRPCVTADGTDHPTEYTHMGDSRSTCEGDGGVGDSDFFQLDEWAASRGGPGVRKCL